MTLSNQAPESNGVPTGTAKDGLLRVFSSELRLRNYSRQTIKTYSCLLQVLLPYFQGPLLGKCVRQLLGHARLETTKVYASVRDPHLLKVRSPL